MAFNFSEWANNLPQEAREKLVEQGYDELSTLRVCTENDIEAIISKQGHKKIVWENIKRLRETSESAVSGSQVSSKLITRTKAEFKADDANEIRIVLFGKTGSGKSSTGNAILGVPPPEKEATSKAGFLEFFGQGSGTKDCRMQTVNINGRTVRVVDTPGVCDTHRDANEVLFEVSKCLLFTSPGPHILLFVINGQARFTKEEYEAYLQLRNIFDATLLKYICIVFTHCEELKDGRKAMEALFETSKKQYELAKLENRDPPDINKVLDDVDRRYIIMHTRGDEAKKDQQVLELLKLVDHLQTVNPCPYFEDTKTKQITKQKDLRIQEIMREKGIRDKTQAWKKLVEELQQADQAAKQKAEMERKLKEEERRRVLEQEERQRAYIEEDRRRMLEEKQKNDKQRQQEEEDRRRQRREQEELAARQKNFQTVAGASVGMSTGALLAGVALTVATGGLAAPLAAAAVGGAAAAGGAAGASAVKGGCCVM